MKCPTCPTTDLLMSERFGIEIDYCPQCRGVWLDRGELDKIIERSMSDLPTALPARQPIHSPQQPYNSCHGQHNKHHDDRHSYHGKHSFWKELFD